MLSEDVSSLNFKLVAMSLVDSPSSSSRRGLLAKAGLLDRIVVGYQVGVPMSTLFECVLYAVFWMC